MTQNNSLNILESGSEDFNFSGVRIKTKAPQAAQFDLSYDYGADLKEIARHPRQMTLYVQALLKFTDLKLQCLLTEDAVRELSLLLGQAGTYSKILGQLDAAQDYLEASLALVEMYDLGMKHFIVQSLRLADVKRFKREWVESKKLYQSVLALCRVNKENDSYLDVVLQHLGKLHFDLSEYPMALSYFREALKIRRQKQDLSLIESTELAIKRTLAEAAKTTRH